MVRSPFRETINLAIAGVVCMRVSDYIAHFIDETPRRFLAVENFSPVAFHFTFSNWSWLFFSFFFALILRFEDEGTGKDFLIKCRWRPNRLWEKKKSSKRHQKCLLNVAALIHLNDILIKLVRLFSSSFMARALTIARRQPEQRTGKTPKSTHEIKFIKF